MWFFGSPNNAGPVHFKKKETCSDARPSCYMSMEKQEQGGAQKNDDRGREWILGATNYGVPLLRVLKACRAEKRGANRKNPMEHP